MHVWVNERNRWIAWRSEFFLQRCKFRMNTKYINIKQNVRFVTCIMLEKGLLGWQRYSFLLDEKIISFQRNFLFLIYWKYTETLVDFCHPIITQLYNYFILLYTPFAMLLNYTCELRRREKPFSINLPPPINKSSESSPHNATAHSQRKIPSRDKSWRVATTSVLIPIKRNFCNEHGEPAPFDIRKLRISFYRREGEGRGGRGGSW